MGHTLAFARGGYPRRVWVFVFSSFLQRLLFTYFVCTLPSVVWSHLFSGRCTLLVSHPLARSVIVGFMRTDCFHRIASLLHWDGMLIWDVTLVHTLSLEWMVVGNIQDFAKIVLQPVCSTLGKTRLRCDCRTAYSHIQVLQVDRLCLHLLACSSGCASAERGLMLHLFFFRFNAGGEWFTISHFACSNRIAQSTRQVALSSFLTAPCDFGFQMHVHVNAYTWCWSCRRWLALFL